MLKSVSFTAENALVACRIFLLLSFLIRLPFVVLYLMDGNNPIFKKWQSVRNEGKYQLYIMLAILMMSLVEMMLHMNNAYQWAQLTPISEMFSWLGTAVAVFSLASYTWIHSKIVSETEQNIVPPKDEKVVESAGPYSVIRYPFMSNSLLIPVVVLLLSHNWFYTLLWCLWVIQAIVSLYEEELLTLELLDTDKKQSMAHQKVIGMLLPLKYYMWGPDLGRNANGKDAWGDSLQRRVDQDFTSMGVRGDNDK